MLARTSIFAVLSLGASSEGSQGKHIEAIDIMYLSFLFICCRRGAKSTNIIRGEMNVSRRLHAIDPRDGALTLRSHHPIGAMLSFLGIALPVSIAAGRYGANPTTSVRRPAGSALWPTWI
jgi:hypothetical protein